MKDHLPILSDAAVQENFRRQLEENRQLRRWLHLLFQAWIDTGLTIPPELQAQFEDALTRTR